MVENVENAKIHIRLIAAMVNKLMRENYKVSANHIGYPNGPPQKFNNFIPDIYATKGKEKIIIEAETSDSLDGEQTRAKWVALSTADSSAEFSIIVPEKCFDKAQKLSEDWGVDITNFWRLEI